MEIIVNTSILIRELAVDIVGDYECRVFVVTLQSLNCSDYNCSIKTNPTFYVKTREK